jgi:DNA-binding response OmpR family regulator
VLNDRPLVVDLITLTLNHGGFVVRAASNLAEAEAILEDWPPNIAVVDMDHDESTVLIERLGTSHSVPRAAMPVLGLTRRGDLKAKLRAFDLGVDDILAVPFSPEELLARSIVITRRASGTDRPLIPVIKLGESRSTSSIARCARATRSSTSPASSRACCTSSPVGMGAS